MYVLKHNRPDIGFNRFRTVEAVILHVLFL